MPELKEYLSVAEGLRSFRKSELEQETLLRKEAREKRVADAAEWDLQQKKQKAKKDEDYARILDTVGTDKYDPQKAAAAALRAGHAGDVQTHLSNMKEQLKKTKFQEKFEDFHSVALFKRGMQKRLADLGNEIVTAKASGDNETAAKLQEQFAAESTAGRDLMDSQLAALDEMMGQTVAINMGDQSDSFFKEWTPEKLDLAAESLKKKISADSLMSSKWMDELEELQEVAGVAVDLSGIPDTKNIYRLATTLVHTEKLPKEMVMDILKIDDPQRLKSFVESEDIPKEARLLAGAVYKKRVAVEAFAPGVLDADIEEYDSESMGIADRMQPGAESRSAKIAKLKEAYKTLAKAKEKQSKSGSLSESARKEIEKARAIIRGASREEIEAAKGSKLDSALKSVSSRMKKSR